MRLAWREEPTGRHHDRKSFDCGSSDLNDDLDRFARQNHEAGGAKTFVAISPTEPTRVLGYYAISPGSVAFARVPGSVTRRLGRYEVPVFRLGRLAIDRSVQGKGLGGDLLLAAGACALAVAAEAGGVALARCQGCRRGGVVRTLWHAGTAGRSTEADLAPEPDRRRD